MQEKTFVGMKKTLENKGYFLLQFEGEFVVVPPVAVRPVKLSRGEVHNEIIFVQVNLPGRRPGKKISCASHVNEKEAWKSAIRRYWRGGW